MAILTQKFFTRPAEKVALDLLGKVLVKKVGNKTLAVKITELEIYNGFEDKASHASRGMTDRNKIMFEEGGFFYIYLIYGMYFMINIVVGKKDHPSAILLRGGEILFYNSHELENNYSSVLQKTAIEKMAGRKKENKNLSGPGKLSKFLKVDKKFNEKKAEPKTGLWFEDWGFKIPKKIIKKSSRIGVNYAGPVWSAKKWRFFIHNSQLG